MLNNRWDKQDYHINTKRKKNSKKRNNVINETKVPVAVHVAKITLHEFKRQQP